MLRTTEIKTAAATRISPRRLLVALLPVLALLVALPASAMAAPAPPKGDEKAPGGGVTASGTGSDSSGDCTATVRTANNTSEVARITVDCGEGSVITNVDLTTNGRNEGTLDGDDGTTCDPDQVAREFDCQPGSDASSISALFNLAQGEAVCLNPVLAVDFVVEVDGTTETIDNLEASGCSDSSGGGGSGSEGISGEDDGSTPEGGVDSGAGGTAKPSDTAGVAGPLSGAALILLLALASGGLLLRKTRTP